MHRVPATRETPRMAPGLRPLALLGFALGVSACQPREAQWPLTCAPGELIGFRPDFGRSQHVAAVELESGRSVRPDARRRGGEFRLSHRGPRRRLVGRGLRRRSGWQAFVCDSGERRMRLNVETLRFAVASETGYRDESNNPTFDRADIALGVCRSEGGGS